MPQSSLKSSNSSRSRTLSGHETGLSRGIGHRPPSELPQKDEATHSVAPLIDEILFAFNYELSSNSREAFSVCSPFNYFLLLSSRTVLTRDCIDSSITPATLS